MLPLVLLCVEIGWMDGSSGRKRTLHVVRLRLPVMLGGRIGTSAGGRVSLRNSPPSIAGEAAVLALLSLVGVGPLIINLETACAASALADRHICPRAS